MFSEPLPAARCPAQQMPHVHSLCHWVRPTTTGGEHYKPISQVRNVEAKRGEVAHQMYPTIKEWQCLGGASRPLTSNFYHTFSTQYIKVNPFVLQMRKPRHSWSTIIKALPTVGAA